MTPTESIPLLIVIVLLLSANGIEPDAMEIHFAGDRTVESIDEVLIVAGGSVTVPDGSAVDGRIFVIDGVFEVAGTIDGPVTQLAGTVTVPDTGTITGEFQTIGGTSTVSGRADIGRRSVVEVDSRAEDSGGRGLLLVTQLVALGALGYLIGRWRPDLLDTVGRAVSQYPGVSTVTGGFSAAVVMVLLIFMAFTLVLLPVSILGLGAVLLTIAYGHVAIGYRLVGPLGIEQARYRATIGAAVLVVLLEIAGLVPFVGSLLAGLVALVGFGAALITYYGLRDFEPPAIPGPS